MRRKPGAECRDRVHVAPQEVVLDFILSFMKPAYLAEFVCKCALNSATLKDCLGDILRSLI